MQTPLLIRSGGGDVVADRAYDSDAVIAQIEALGVKAIIPSRSHRKVARTLDEETYRKRNVIERWFGRVKGYRRIATRYEDMAVIRRVRRRGRIPGCAVRMADVTRHTTFSFTLAPTREQEPVLNRHLERRGLRSINVCASC